MRTYIIEAVVTLYSVFSILPHHPTVATLDYKFALLDNFHNYTAPSKQTKPRSESNGTKTANTWLENRCGSKYFDWQFRMRQRPPRLAHADNYVFSLRTFHDYSMLAPQIFSSLLGCFRNVLKHAWEIHQFQVVFYGTLNCALSSLFFMSLMVL